MHLLKICLKDIRLLASVRLFLCPLICYAILLVLNVFCFRKPTQIIYRRFRTLHSFCPGINYNEFIMNDFGSRSTSVGQLQKYAASAKLLIRLFLSIRTLTRLQKLLKLQLKISVRRNVFIMGYVTFSLGCYTVVCCSIASLAGRLYIFESFSFIFIRVFRPSLRPQN